jgi:hypothetical protein
MTKNKNKFYFILFSFIIVALSACSSEKKIYSMYNGKCVTLMKPCVLCEVSKDKVIFPSVRYELHESNSQIPKFEYHISAGSTIYIQNIYNIISDTRGSWVGALGSWKHPSGEVISFVYCWSLGSRLSIAPWENLNNTKNRTENEVP